MSNEVEKILDSIAANNPPSQEDYTDSETGLLFCSKCHTPTQCCVTLFGKEKLMPCTCRCHQEKLAAEEQARKEQQRLDRIRRLKANVDGGGERTGGPVHHGGPVPVRTEREAVPEG